MIGDLQPCPVCLKKKVELMTYDGSLKFETWVECHNCGFTTMTTTGKTPEEAEKKTLRNWNRRAKKRTGRKGQPKSCPCCTGKSTTVHTVKHKYSTHCWVQCMKCKSFSDRSFTDLTSDLTRVEAINLWNTGKIK